MPVHTPLLHVSPTVQKRPSSQAVASASGKSPQTPAVQVLSWHATVDGGQSPLTWHPVPPVPVPVEAALAVVALAVADALAVDTVDAVALPPLPPGPGMTSAGAFRGEHAPAAAVAESSPDSDNSE